MKTARQFAIASVLVFVTGCACSSVQRELEQVAKDWSMVIRASQVIPVYPLTEDLQPGDVFLVQQTVDTQHTVYTQKGFLPLDNMIWRLQPANYQQFYGQSFGIGGEGKALPQYFMKPDDAIAPWSPAPTASFPTYSISTRRGGGFNLALPIQGVPIGLSLLGGDAAQGTVTIADARTYGIDTISLHKQVSDWAEDERRFLANFASTEHHTNYLRVITRVYLTGKLNVSLESSRTRGGELTGGVRKPVDLVLPEAGTDPQKVSMDDYKKRVDELNTMIENALKKSGAEGVERLLPGGTVKVVAASARTVNLSETFSRPLVIGYLGFDMAIRAGGMLGPPIPTYAVLHDRMDPGTTPAVQTLSNSSLRRDYTILKELSRQGDHEATELVKELDALAKAVPPQYRSRIFAFPGPNEPLSVRHDIGSPLAPENPTFPVLTSYRGTLLSSIGNLKLVSEDKSKMITGFSARDDRSERYIQQQIEENQQALKEIDASLKEERLLLDRVHIFVLESQ
jgi:hypothetical protein